MAKKETNPIKTMMVINTVLLVGIVAVLILWPSKTENGKTGRILFNKNGEDPIADSQPLQKAGAEGSQI